MKKLLFVVVLLFSGALTAQTLNFGAKAGVNFASLSGDDAEDLDSRTGFHLGLIGEVMLTDRFAIQPEVLYSAQGAEIEDETWKLDYISVPVMAKYFVTNGLSLEAGPQFSFNTTSEAEIDGETEEIDAESMDIGLGLGLGYEFMQSIFVQARYNMGLSDVLEDVDAKNSVFQLSLGYKF